MAYDHRIKAGNQGDVVKHVALIAMTRHAITASKSIFKYADAFSGPAGSLLLPKGEWADGIGKVSRSGDVNSPDVRRWIDWYLARPQLLGARYPGSALIVSDVATAAAQSHEMTLWDISCDAVADLRNVFPTHNIVHESVEVSHSAIGAADFLFIDPPALAEQWELVRSLMTFGKSMLAWLPINAAVTLGSVKPSALSEEQFREVSALPSTHRTRVVWARGGRTIGCLLVYRTTEKAAESVRAAVDEVVSLSSWTHKEVEHFGPESSVLVDVIPASDAAPRDGQAPQKAVDHDSNHPVDEWSALGVLSLVCGDSHSVWLSHQGADEARHFSLLRELLRKLPSRSRRCELSFDGCETWVPLVVRLVSDSQIAWKAHNANASAAARIRVAFRA